MITRLPFTLFFLIVMVLSNALAGTLNGTLSDTALTDWGINHLSIQQGDVYRLVSGTFLSHDLGMFLRQVVFAAAVIGLYEWTEGTRRALAMFLLIDITGTLLVLFAILPGLVAAHPAIDATALAVFDVGMSAGGFGLIGALVAQRRLDWLYLLVICAAIFVKLLISFDAIADSAHLLCLFLGFAVQKALNTYTGKDDIVPR